MPLAIIVWLVNSMDERQMAELRDRPKNWPLLLGAFALAISAVCMTFYRWYLLVRALDLPFRVRDAFRLGFLGYLLNFVSVGAVGGDFFKAFFIAREKPGRRTEAVATVIVDRVIGMYALFVVAALAAVSGILPSNTPELVSLARIAYVGTIVGGVGILFLAMPGLTGERVIDTVTHLPIVGNTLERLVVALHMYRKRPGVLLAIALISITVHGLFSSAIYMIATALFAVVPSYGEHFVIAPLSMLAGTVPTPGGLGAIELAMDKIYSIVQAQKGGTVSGVTVALAFRLVTIVIAGIGMVYYWIGRREVRAVLDEVAHSEEELDAEFDAELEAELHELHERHHPHE